jgi:predicted esterase
MRARASVCAVSRHERYSISATVHGHCLVEAPDTGGPHPLVVGFHGYGETAEIHAERMRRIPGGSECVLASLPALHLFYTKGGEVVGSWMTKQDREQAAADNVAYVAEAVARIKRELPVDDRLAYVGFSQGVAMAYRAAAGAGHPCQALVAIGGDMPPEVAADPAVRWPAVLLTRGESDSFFTREKMERDLECLRGRGASPQALVFDGGHEWADPVFAAIGELIARAFARSPARGSR